MLQPDQKKQLKELLSHDISASERRRVQLLLLYDRGLTTSEIAKEVDLSPGRVRYWRRAFLSKGMNVFQSVSDLTDISEGADVMATHHEDTAVEDPSPPPETTLKLDKAPTPPGLAQSEEIPEPIHPPAPIAIEAFRQLHKTDHRHAEHVRDLALQLFELLQPIHNVSDVHSRLLSDAALLHDIAVDTQDKIDPKMGMDLVRNNPLVDYSEQEQYVLAALVEQQRGKVKRKDLDRLDNSLLDQADALILIALLRIAIDLDASHSQTTQIDQLIESPLNLYLVVKGEHAAQDASSAQRRGKLWNNLFKQPLHVITEQQAQEASIRPGRIPFPEPMKSPGVEPDDTLAEAGRKTLRYHFAEMLRHEEGTKLGEDIEALHDMRVAVRRMRVTFEIFQDAFAKKVIQSHRKGLRAIGRSLGRVRDLDVFMEKANHYLEALPEKQHTGLSPLLNAWEEQRQIARERMSKFLEGDGYQSFLDDFNIFVNTPGAGAKKGGEDYHVPNIVRHVAPVMIYNRLGAVRAYEQILDTARIEQLHELRIEFKRLRYTMEFFREVLGPEAKLIVEEIKTVQDHLGDLNDADVACQILTDFLERWEARQQTLLLNERESPEPIVAYLASRHAERHRLMVTFGETWKHFDQEEFRNNLALAVAVL